MDSLTFHNPPPLRDPLFVTAFSGWNDAAESATHAVQYLVDHLGGERFAWIEPEEFFQFSDQRPMVSLTETGERRIRWPANEFFYCRSPGLGRDLVVGIGVEPHLRWKTFGACVLEVCRRCGVRMTVTLGALLSGESHKSPIHLVCLATDPALAERSGVEVTTYEGPTGIVGVIHNIMQDEGIPAVSLWANVPHYIGGFYNPKATFALLERLCRAGEISLDLEGIEQSLGRFDRQVEDAIARDPRISRYLSDVESGKATLEDGEDLVLDDEDIPALAEDVEEDELPPGDQVADEIERLLRRRRGGPEEG